MPGRGSKWESRPLISSGYRIQMNRGNETTCRSQFEKKRFTRMYSGSEAGSNLRLVDFVYRSNLVLRVMKKKEEQPAGDTPSERA